MRGVWALELKYWGSGVRVRLGLRWWWCVCVCVCMCVCGVSTHNRSQLQHATRDSIDVT